MRRTEVLIDTAFAIALLNVDDEHHVAAVTLGTQLRNQVRLVLTRPVCLEIGNAMSDPRRRAQTARFLAGMAADPNVEILPWSESVYSQALALFRSRPDKAWSLTDCTSFVVMRDRGITDALTTDNHFRQAGFQPLLRPAAN
ncbi:type II toxin-antitoxin system VapC family toxin [Longimicrobium sp.]|uniref:type II toxin-antitoxin system VapC family toxin n=1 Tax=Longimicrobium sp. TaxID=2029185 RepID=UPI002B84AC75|nr:PIN domain-containing protein [Longimicrobium sp.]HSU17232.1 PIN domain-containing protein [Longimicrobium sp.]